MLDTHESVELAVVVPTFNERDNVEVLLARLDQALADVRWEVIFVDDDSPDETARLLHTLSARHPRVRCLRRIGRRGLSGACVEGMLATGAPVMAVIDADLQHDETLLPRMLQVMRAEPIDLVIGTRYAHGGSVGEWQASRLRMSQLATRLARGLLGTSLSDPMSGFFMIRREAFEASVYRLSGIGFKILVDLVASSPRPLRIRELPFRFAERHAGSSKLDSRVAWEFLMLLADKLVGRWLPVRLLSFGLVGTLGVGVHLLVLSTLLSLPGMAFVAAQASAVLLAMISNFALNNALTYRDQRLTGWRQLSGLLKFMATCGVGALANVGVAAYLNRDGTGWLLSALAGILVGTVWNYGVTSHLVWSAGRRR
ncbi:MAG: glycosyltransferase family 2 protein [Burkholderiales bacterium]|jgi:dolichol-phosphate mannosyltransferase